MNNLKKSPNSHHNHFIENNRRSNLINRVLVNNLYNNPNSLHHNFK